MNPKAIDDMGMAIADVYASVVDRILINLAHHFPYVQHDQHIGSWQYQSLMLAQMGKVEQETIDIIAKSLGGADEALKQSIIKAIFEGIKNEENYLKNAASLGLLGAIPPTLDPSQMQAFTYYYKQSADRLNLVNTVMLDSTKQAYQATVADVAQKIANTQGILNTAAGEVVTGVSTWNGAMHSAVQKMVANGITGFVDHAGHKWSPEAYVAMDVRTTLFNTARQAVWERQEQYGSDLYQVSSHNAARPLCYPWQGKVISTSGRTGTTFDIDGNEVIIHSQDEIESFRYGGGLFGVNCGHYPMVFIPNFSSLKGEPHDQTTNDREYELTQQQRALERKLREEKRDLEVMKAQGAPADQIKVQRERVRSASADIEEFCDETGLPRRRNREYTPINATFPDTVPPITPTPPIQPPLPPVQPNISPNIPQQPVVSQTIDGKANKLKSTMPSDDYNKVVAMVDNAPTAKLYDRYADTCNDIQRVKGGGVYQTALDRVVYDFNTEPNMSRYSTMAHEMGHMFDKHMGRIGNLTFNEVDLINQKCVVGNGTVKVLKVVPSASDQFLTAMRADMVSLNAVLKNSTELAKMKTGAMRNASAGVQDAMDGFWGTQKKNLLPWGHGDKYYNRFYNNWIKGFGKENELKDVFTSLGFDASNQTKVKQLARHYDAASELWANCVSAITCGGDELDAFNQYMPNTVQAVLDIIGGM